MTEHVVSCPSEKIWLKGRGTESCLCSSSCLQEENCS